MNAPGRITGSEVGDYHVLRRVGEGGMGIVYEALNEQINKRVAIKVLKPEAAAGDADQEALLQEAQAVNAIGHRNLVGVFGAGRLPDGRRYLVMEYLDGEPLDAYLDRHGPLSHLEACELLQEICSPLHAAHQHGIIHRDLKPGNVFMVKQGEERFLKLLDFGLARRGVKGDNDDGQTRDMVVRGSPDYMSPEQCTNQTVSARTDLYSLGSIAYEMLTGRAPFRNDDAPVIEIMMKKVKQRAPALPPTVPLPLAELVAALLETDPMLRPATADLVRQRLRRIARMIKTGAREIVVTGERKVPLPAETEKVPAQDLPPIPKRKPKSLAVPIALSVGAFLAVATGGTVVLVRRARLAAQPPVVEMGEPAPSPPAPAPVPEPSEVPQQIDELGPEPTSPNVRRPAPAPSVEELKKRLDGLKVRLKRRANPDKNAEPELNHLFVLLTLVKTPAERIELMRDSQAWEKKHLR